MPSTPEQFALDVAAWVAKAKANAMRVVTETIQDINEEVVTTTPVDTGFLRGSWFASIGASPAGSGAAGRDPLGTMGLEVAALKPGDVYYAGNTAAYALRLEYGFHGQDALGRTYDQRGRFWVTAVMNRAPAIAQAAAQRVAGRA